MNTKLQYDLPSTTDSLYYLCSLLNTKTNTLENPLNYLSLLSAIFCRPYIVTRNWYEYLGRRIYVGWQSQRKKSHILFLILHLTRITVITICSNPFSLPNLESNIRAVAQRRCWITKQKYLRFSYIFKCETDRVSLSFVHYLDLCNRADLSFETRIDLC